MHLLLLFKRHKVVRFLISPKKKKVKIEVNKIMNPAGGNVFNIFTLVKDFETKKQELLVGEYSVDLSRC